MTAPVTGELLRLDNVGVRLGGREILRDVSLTIRPGEFTGLIGPNGAGKTTLLRIMLGLQAVNQGSVLIDGEPRAARDASIGYVPQKLGIEPDTPLRVRDVVSLGVDGHKFGIRLPSRARRELVDDMLTAVGARRFADARIGELSGGEQQRVMIAHALIGRPGCCCSTSRWPTWTSPASRGSSRCWPGWPRPRGSRCCSRRTT